MRNILKSFLEPKAEAYVLPDTDDIFMGGEDEFRPLEAEEAGPWILRPGGRRSRSPPQRSRRRPQKRRRPSTTPSSRRS